MAISPDSGDPQRRYEFIEKAYCEGRWDTVLETGTLLLRALSESGDQPDGSGLRPRLQLLMAHTLLHGYGDRDAAEDLYEVVRKSDAEASLRQIAEDGLDQCHRPLSPTFVAEESDGEEVLTERPGLFLPETETAEEEPLPAQKQAEPLPPLSFHPPKATTTEREPQPEEEVPDLARVRARGKEEEAPSDLGLAADPFQHPGVLPLPTTVASEEPVMPWLTSAESSPVEPAGESPEVPEPASPEPISLVPTRLTLIPEVVEEPELMEVHQASPDLAEEVDLVLSADVVSLSDARANRRLEPIDDLEDLRASLVKVVVVA